uniref:Uncharacterized protein n=1 Tax=viral metagenome TaxID=1070528 RepID=A0A6C0HKH3_9ZZZZ
MFIYDWVLPVCIGIICTCFLMAILYTDVGAQHFTNLVAITESNSMQNNANNANNAKTANSNLPITSAVYNYYPQTPLNIPILKDQNINTSINNRAFINQPSSEYNAHTTAYYGEFPYPLPMQKWIPTNIDSVKANIDK